MKHSHCPSVYHVLTCMIFIILSVTSAKAAVIAGPMTNPVNGHVYYLLDAASWTASEAEAIALGGHLVTINDAAENDWVFDSFVPLLPSGSTSIWLGLNDAQDEGSFVWASGETVTYTNWSDFQPDDAHDGEDYAHMWTPGIIPQAPEVFRQWNDFPDNVELSMHGLVENIPEPSSFWLLAAGLLVLNLRHRVNKRHT